MDQEYLYGNYVRDLHNRFMRRLEDIEAEYNFDNGPEFEIAICEILRSFLPLKYGICRGFVVNADGRKEGDDIIIYDQERFPTLRSLTSGNYSLKEKIPIEAVYAYIEAKHTLAFKTDLTDSTLRTAYRQCSKIKRLINGRKKVNPVVIDKYFSSENYVPESNSESFPMFRNPAFAMVISRYVSLNGKRLNDRYEIADLMNSCRLDESDPNNPDFVIAGPHNLIIPSLEIDNEISQTLFLLAEHPNSVSALVTRENMSYGIFMAELGYVLDWIMLGTMPWSKILIDAVKPVR